MKDKCKCKCEGKGEPKETLEEVLGRHFGLDKGVDAAAVAHEIDTRVAALGKALGLRKDVDGYPVVADLDDEDKAKKAAVNAEIAALKDESEHLTGLLVKLLRLQDNMGERLRAGQQRYWDDLAVKYNLDRDEFGYRVTDADQLVVVRDLRNAENASDGESFVEFMKRVVSGDVSELSDLLAKLDPNG